MAEEIGCVCADPAYVQELAIGETLASVERVARLESKYSSCHYHTWTHSACAYRKSNTL